MKESAKPKRRGAGRLSAEEAAKLPERLLDAAQAIFVEKGFANTTMDEIAKRAGSSTQTIYARFPSKTDVLQAVVLRFVERQTRALAAAHLDDPHGVAPLDYLVTAGCEVAAGFSTGIAGINRIAFSEAHRMPELRLVSSNGFGRGVERLRLAMEAWREDGVLNPTGDLTLTATICMSMLTDRPRIRAVLGDPMNAQETHAYVSRAAEIFLHGCEHVAPKAAPAKGKRKIARD